MHRQLSAEKSKSEEHRKFSLLILWRGVRKRCPKCGLGGLLNGYLKPASYCLNCGEDFSYISADDGPAWLTLLIIGHVIAPLMLIFGRDTTMSVWLSIVIIMIIALLGIYFILPRAKGVFIVLIWVTDGTGRGISKS